MKITVNEFLGMALDNNFEFAIYDFSKDKNIFDSQRGKELPGEIGDMSVQSWDINNGIIELNIDSGDK